MNWMGLPVMRSASLAQAIMEPVNATAPTSTAKKMAMEVTTPGLGWWMYSAQPTSIEARPPEPLNSATISGIWVIFTTAAVHQPMAPPTTRPTMIQM